MSGITVDTGALARALRSVLPHACTDPEKAPPELCRVRLQLAGADVHVTATNGVTAAVAVVPVLDHGTGEAVTVDLSPADVKGVLALFRPVVKDAISGEDVLEVAATEKQVTIRDVAGMLPGKEATWPVSNDDDYPDVEALVGRHLGAGDLAVPPPTKAGDFLTQAHLLGLFAAAAKAYNEPLQLSRRGKGTVLVACSDAFLGALSVVGSAEALAVPPFDEALWRDRLPAEARWQPASVEVRQADDPPPNPPF